MQSRIVLQFTVVVAISMLLGACGAAADAVAIPATSSPVPNSVPVTSSVTLPNAIVGVAYSRSLGATGGDGVLVWSAASGALPVGLTLASNGVISGTPMTYGSSTLVVRVADSDAISGSADEDIATVTLTTLPANIPLSSSPLRVVVIGASTPACKNLVEGGYALADCWVNRLDAYLQSVRPGSAVINLAVSGTGTCGALPSGLIVPLACNNAGSKASGHPIPDLQGNITKALSLNPSVVLVNYPHEDKIGVDATLANLQAIQDAATAAGVPIFVSTSQPKYADGSDLASRLDQRSRVIAAFGSRAMDFWTPLTDPVTGTMLVTMVNHYDDVHPNDEGHRMVYAAVRVATGW